jgi:hypothetical protein
MDMVTTRKRKITPRSSKRQKEHATSGKNRVNVIRIFQFKANDCVDGNVDNDNNNNNYYYFYCYHHLKSIHTDVKIPNSQNLHNTITDKLQTCTGLKEYGK